VADGEQRNAIDDDEEISLAVEPVTKELGAEVVRYDSVGKPLGGELFVLAADLDFPRTDLPDGTTILATEECWRTFCKAALPHERADAFRMLIAAEAHAT
jgi:hypothetical protein